MSATPVPESEGDPGRAIGLAAFCMDDRDRLRQGPVLAGAEPGSPAAAIPIVEPAGRDLEVDGFLWFFGRKDSLIKVAGHRVGAEEIEVAATQSSHAFQAVAYGVPDPVFGQVVHLAVEPPSGTPTGILPHTTSPDRPFGSHPLAAYVDAPAGGP